MDKRSKSSPLKTRESIALLNEFQARFGAAMSEPKLIEQHQRLLVEFESAHAVWKKDQFLVAENFNILNTLKLTRKELCHSDILAWLLDPRLEVGTHAQGNLGFRLFLQRLNLPPKYADAKDYRVVREASGKDVRLDIVIEADRQFVIGIENKVDSDEGENQTQREWDVLERRWTKLLVPRSNKIEAFFLTPGEMAPLCKRFKAISWRQIADIFEDFAEEARPKMVKLFAQHYADTLRNHIISETELEEKYHENAH